jgi:hypothetical protein
VNRKLSLLKSLSLAALLCSAAARADITVYTSQAAFLAATTAQGVDTFDDLEVVSYGGPLTRSAGAYTYRATSGPVSNLLWGAGGTGDHWLSNNVLTDSITFSNFCGCVTALGGNFFGSDFAGQFIPGTNMILTASNGTTTTTAYLNDTTVTSFLGFVSTAPLTSVVLTSGGLYWTTANNLTLALAAPVPEPASYGMLLAGLCLLGGLAVRRAG